jgi:hypothetical protein
MVILSAIVSVSYAEQRSSVSQFGITWTFDTQYECGQFVNGDWWVVGPVNIVAIDPPSCVTVAGDTDLAGDEYPSGTVVNGSMINPNPTAAHLGYTSRFNYDAALNVAIGVSEESPLLVDVNSSLISTRTKMHVYSSADQSVIKTAAILTVTASAPDSGCFRPAYCGTDKTVLFHESNLDYSKLQALATVATAPLLADVESHFEKPWLDHLANFTSRYMHPYDNMQCYGREITKIVGQGALMLNLDLRGGDEGKNNNELKRKLLIGYVQVGIDLYGIVQNGGNRQWVANGGHQMGRKLPILFAGAMLHDADMLAIGEKSGDYLYSVKPGGGYYGRGDRPPDYISFQEDEQTFYVTASDVGRPLDVMDCRGYATSATTNTIGVVQPSQYTYLFGCYIVITSGPGSGQRRYVTESTVDRLGGAGILTVSPAWDTIPVADSSYYEIKGYEAHHIGMPEWGVRSASETGRDTPSFYAEYRAVNGQVWGGQVLAAHIMGFKTLWHNNAMFDFQDRFIQMTSLGGPYYSYKGDFIDSFAKSMWQAYRANYDCVYSGLDTLTHERQYTGCSGMRVGSDRTILPAAPAGLVVYPNPMKNDVTINVAAGHGLPLQVHVYDHAGNVVRTIGTKDNASNYNTSLQWNGTDLYGQSVDPGVYYIKYADQVRKIIRIK